jgi:CRP-like cAMP-binding protein
MFNGGWSVDQGVAMSATTAAQSSPACVQAGPAQRFVLWDQGHVAGAGNTQGHVMATKPMAPKLPATKRPPAFDPKAFLARIGDGRSIGKYGKGKVVFSQGDAGDAVFYIQKGKAKLTVVSEQGREAVIAILGTDDFFGEGCLAGQTKRIATVTAMSDSVIVRLEKSAIVRVLHEEPAFSEKFIAHLLGRSIRVEADLVDQLFNSSEKRLARLLLLLANFGKDGAPEPVIPKISQETLADMIGTTRSRVSFFMNKFRKLGFIHYNGGIEVHSSLLNVVLHDQSLIAPLDARRADESA